jgi:hypothetical protein
LPRCFAFAASFCTHDSGAGRFESLDGALAWTTAVTGSCTALMRAAAEGQAEAVKMLVEVGHADYTVKMVSRGAFMFG